MSDGDTFIDHFQKSPRTLIFARFFSWSSPCWSPARVERLATLGCPPAHYSEFRPVGSSVPVYGGTAVLSSGTGKMSSSTILRRHRVLRCNIAKSGWLCGEIVTLFTTIFHSYHGCSNNWPMHTKMRAAVRQGTLFWRRCCTQDGRPGWMRPRGCPLPAWPEIKELSLCRVTARCSHHSTVPPKWTSSRLGMLRKGLQLKSPAKNRNGNGQNRNITARYSRHSTVPPKWTSSSATAT